MAPRMLGMLDCHISVLWFLAGLCLIEIKTTVDLWVGLLLGIPLGEMQHV